MVRCGVGGRALSLHGAGDFHTWSWRVTRRKEEHGGRKTSVRKQSSLGTRNDSEWLKCHLGVWGWNRTCPDRRPLKRQFSAGLRVQPLGPAWLGLTSNPVGILGKLLVFLCSVSLCENGKSHSFFPFSWGHNEWILIWYQCLAHSKFYIGSATKTNDNSKTKAKTPLQKPHRNQHSPDLMRQEGRQWLSRWSKKSSCR